MISPNPGGPGSQLDGVAARTSGDAWAVGSTATDKTLVAHWNGKSWKQVRSPTPGGGDELFGVTVLSPGNAWAIGEGNGEKTIALHWNGHSWSHVGTPSPFDNFTRQGSFLFGVDGTSAKDVWAVGGIIATNKTLILALEWHQVESGRRPEPARRRPTHRGRRHFCEERAGRRRIGRGRREGPILAWNGKTWS